MSEEQASFSYCILLLLSLVLSKGQWTAGETDKEVLLALKGHLEQNNRFNRGEYAKWNSSDSSPCSWHGITCNGAGSVTGINLSGSNISGCLFSTFSLLTELTRLDLSSNTIGGPIHADDLNKCSKLEYLNISNNLIDGAINLTGLTNLVALDLTFNRLNGSIRHNFPAICGNLVLLNISTNMLSGDITGCFDACPKLEYLDISSNQFIGHMWSGFPRLRQLFVSENFLTGEFPTNTFAADCGLEILDLSRNNFSGAFPDSIANCSKLTTLNLWGNKFDGPVPSGIGSLSELSVLYMGNNSFDRNIPEQLLNCAKLVFLDFSKNNFAGDVQEIFGNITTLEYLILHGNQYTGGIEESRILKLPKLIRLDLSFNNFTGNLPVEITTMPKLKLLILAYNEFSGSIPAEFGKMVTLQSLDLSYNKLTGSIPTALGNLTSLLWMMLAGNHLTGEIPSEIGNCSSLLWLNLADNQLSGGIPPEIGGIGSNPWPTFETNRREITGVAPGSGDCLAMRRWIPATYPPFNFTYELMTRKSCRTIWDRILKGYGIFPICANSSSQVRTLTISGYIQFSGNKLSGMIPPEIGRMKNASLIHLDFNRLSGSLPPEISKLPLVVLNVSYNNLSGAIPVEIGRLRCLSSLDLSVNNLSGELPGNLNDLSGLNKFNVSYNPLLSGVLPSTGQISTFGNDSFIGDPLIRLPSSSLHNRPPPAGNDNRSGGRSWRATAFWVFLALTSVLVVCGGLSLVAICFGRTRSAVVDPDADPECLLLDGVKRRSDVSGSWAPTPSESSMVRAFRLETGKADLAFTYGDIVAATGNFDEGKVVGRGGCGVVFEGVLPGGRRVAVKKMSRWRGRRDWEEDAGEREFRAEMEVMAAARARGHPNLVTLYGWFLAGDAAMLVYEFMEGGNLDEVICDWGRFGWRQRVAAAKGVARALAFLHHECTPAVVHRDVKASNVMLDARGRARVTDFGLARSVGPGRSHVSTVVAGTVGYVAPEYCHSWRATTRGDVYSYGVLAMELATGRRALDGGEEECLVDRVRREAAEEGGLRAPGDEEGAAEMLELLKVGLRCVAESPLARPDMREVLATLLKITGSAKASYTSSSPYSGSRESPISSPSSVQYWGGYF